MTKTLKGLEYKFTYVTTTDNWTDPRTHVVVTFNPASINSEMQVCGLCKAEYQDHVWEGPIALNMGEDLRSPLLASLHRDLFPLGLVSGKDSTAYKDCTALIEIVSEVKLISKY